MAMMEKHGQHDRAQHMICDHCDIPEGMTIDEWRRLRCKHQVSLVQRFLSLFRTR